eukprot:scaffold1272_cov250-Pinguiococcus_pyrenoidosus.AAC.85
MLDTGNLDSAPPAPEPVADKAPAPDAPAADVTEASQATSSEATSQVRETGLLAACAPSEAEWRGWNVCGSGAMSEESARGGGSRARSTYRRL